MTERMTRQCSRKTIRQKQLGFTLIEVLIAAVIMFTVLATATLSFRSALTASERASRTTELLAPLPWITSTIRDRLRDRVLESPTPEYSGDGAIFGVDYQFDAELVRFAPPPPRFDVDAREFVKYAPRFGLYDVQLTLERDGETSSFIYQELAWRPHEL